MATYVLIHGGGDVGWYWHLVEDELRSRGHDVVAPDLPCDDDSAGLPEYGDAVVDAIGDRTDLVVVAQSLGGFTAPLICDRVTVDLLILVAPMIPAPGEAPADYWSDTRYEDEAREPYEDAGCALLSRRSTRAGVRGADAREGAVGGSDARAVPSCGVAQRADADLALSRRSSLSGLVPSPRGPGTSGHHAG